MKALQEHTGPQEYPDSTIRPDIDPLEWVDHSSVSTMWDLPDSAGMNAPVSGKIKATETAADVFGPNSRIETTGMLSGPPEPNPVHQSQNELMLDGLILVLFFYYCIYLFRYRSSILLLLRSFVMPGHFDALIEEQSVTFRNFTRNSCLIGFLSLLAIALKWGIIWDESQVRVMFPDQLTPYWLPILAAIFLSIFLYKRIIVGIIAVLNRGNGYADKIKIFNRLWFALVALLLAPVSLLCGLADFFSQRWLFIFEVIVLITIALFYVVKSLSFFMSRKIPFLQWILYLCAVEIWPVSFYILFAFRGFEW